MDSTSVLPDLDDRSSIRRLVVDFYRLVATDDLLGPIFEDAGVDWNGHVETITDFWAWQLLGIRGYEGNPLRAHEPLHARNPFEQAHFDRWLELFTSTVDERFAGPRAEVAKVRARKMANALQRLLGGVSDAPSVPVAAMWPSSSGANNAT